MSENETKLNINSKQRDLIKELVSASYNTGRIEWSAPGELPHTRQDNYARKMVKNILEELGLNE